MLVGLTVLAVVLTVVAFTVIRPATLFPGPDEVPGPTATEPPTGSPTDSPTQAPAGELGQLGVEAEALGLSCTVELPDPLIGGCYGRAGDGSRSLRWQGPADQPVALDSYVYSDDAGYQFGTELGSVLGPLARSGVWTADDLTTVEERLVVADGETRNITISWGRLTVKASKYTLSLTGVRKGETAQPVAPKTFPTPQADLERAAEDLGYTCDTSSSSSDEYSTCTDPQGNYVSISSYQSPDVESLFATFTTADGPRQFVGLVAVAAPADAAALSGLITEGATTPTVSYRATDGWLVLCTRADDEVSCSVYGAGWE